MTHVWRTRRTLAGAELGSAWVDDFELPTQRARVLKGRLFPKQEWEASPGLEALPFCHVCGSSMVWRGTWQCQGCSVRGGLAVDGTSTPSALPREALAGVPIFSSSEGNNSTERAAWLWSVEALTSFHRRKVAARTMWRGTRPTEVVDAETGEVRNGTPYLSPWHEQRVRGQAERFERVAACGTFEHKLVITDEGGHERSVPVAKKCDCWRVCHRCLNKRKWKLSQGMKQQRAVAFKRFYRERSMGYGRGKEGRWSEKLITFTVPHGAGGPADDARALVGAWQLLLRRLRKHLLARAGVGASKGLAGKHAVASVPWCRALEVGTRNGEHAHMHVWYFGPFIDVALLQVWWGKILEDAGRVPMRKVWKTVAHGRDSRLAEWLGNPRPDDDLPWGIVDIGGKGDSAGAYTAKVGVSMYITKGTDTLRMEPAHAASIYEVFEGTRAVQWARGWAPPKKPLKALCVSFRRLTDEEKALLNHTSLTRRNQAKNGQNDVENVARIRVVSEDVPILSAMVVADVAVDGPRPGGPVEQLRLIGLE